MFYFSNSKLIFPLIIRVGSRRDEDLMIYTLKFNNQTHTGTLTHIFDAAISFYQFNITKIPAGKYEAYSIVGEEAPTMTEKYYQILHIQ